MKKVALLEDDLKLASQLVQFLKGFDFDCFHFGRPSLFLSSNFSDYQLLLLDIMLPEMSGVEVLKKLRGRSNLPVIMLTARGEVNDRILGLELGADDYLAKPFEPRELVARMDALTRRISKNSQSLENKLKFGSLQIDLNKMDASLNDESINLSSLEFDLLKILTSHPGKVFSRDEIMIETQGHETEAFNRSIDIAISRLRQKLQDDPKSPKWIKTLRNKGYSFVGNRDE